MSIRGHIAVCFVVLLAAGLAGLLWTGSASAQQAEEPAEPPARAPAEAIDWDAAPRPDQASGVEIPADTSGDGILWVPRVLLFVPKWTLIAVASPIRLAAWAYERYQLQDRFQRVFFNVDGTFGAFPVAFFETGFGLNVGARVVHKDLFGGGEGLRLRFGFGGELDQVYEARVSSGDRFGQRFSLSLEAQYQRRPKDNFFGIGNGEDGEPGMQIDPLTDDASVASRFRQDVTRFVLRSQIELFSHVSLYPSAAVAYRDFDEVEIPGNDSNIAENYDLARLPGFLPGSSNVYGELELRYDSRDRASEYESKAVDATGWLISGFVGWQEGFSDDPSSFMRYGLDLQRFVDLFGGNRILALRVLIDAAAYTGGEVQEVPFVDLPRLGGVELLRGYQADRFRDRVTAMASAEYLWDLGMYMSAFLFVDAGRPYRTWNDFELSGMRVGFGGGLQLHTSKSFLGRIHLASSRDGGVFFSFSLNPLYHRRERAGRI